MALGEVLEVLGLVAAAGAALTALGYMLKLARKAVRKLDAIDALVSRELERNHGSSMKDDLHGIAVGLGVLQRDFRAHLGDYQRAMRRLERMEERMH